MHTFQGDDVTIHHNGDYSGNVRIRGYCPDETVDMTIQVPMYGLLEFVGQYMQSLAINKVERASGYEFIHEHGVTI